MEEFDLVVMGSGLAGVAAAHAAASRGLTVALIDKNKLLGGQSTNSLIGSICGLYSTGPDPKMISGIYSKKIASFLSSKPVAFKDKLWFLPVDESELSSVLKKEIDLPNLKYFSSTNIFGGECNNTKILSLKLEDQTIHGRYFVDASGTGISKDIFDHPLHNKEIIQCDSFSFKIESSRSFQEIYYETLNLVADKKIDPSFKNLSSLPGIDNRIKLTFESSLNEKEIRTVIESWSSKIKDLKITELPITLGNRTGTQLTGMTTLTKCDVIDAKKVQDPVSRSSWPIELWRNPRTPDLFYVKDKDYYEISMNSLISNKFNNLLFAGRTISADSYGIGSARVLAQALDTGYACGWFINNMLKDTHCDYSELF